jgi:hypothetical protein
MPGYYNDSGNFIPCLNEKLGYSESCVPKKCLDNNGTFLCDKNNELCKDGYSLRDGQCFLDACGECKNDNVCSDDPKMNCYLNGDEWVYCPVGRKYKDGSCLYGICADGYQKLIKTGDVIECNKIPDIQCEPGYSLRDGQCFLDACGECKNDNVCSDDPKMNCYLYKGVWKFCPVGRRYEYGSCWAECLQGYLKQVDEASGEIRCLAEGDDCLNHPSQYPVSCGFIQDYSCFDTFNKKVRKSTDFMNNAPENDLVCSAICKSTLRMEKGDYQTEVMAKCMAIETQEEKNKVCLDAVLSVVFPDKFWIKTLGGQYLVADAGTGGIGFKTRHKISANDSSVWSWVHGVSTGNLKAANGAHQDNRVTPSDISDGIATYGCKKDSESNFVPFSVGPSTYTFVDLQGTGSATDYIVSRTVEGLYGHESEQEGSSWVCQMQKSTINPTDSMKFVVQEYTPPTPSCRPELYPPPANGYLLALGPDRAMGKADPDWVDHSNTASRFYFSESQGESVSMYCTDDERVDMPVYTFEYMYEMNGVSQNNLHKVVPVRMSDDRENYSVLYPSSGYATKGYLLLNPSNPDLALQRTSAGRGNYPMYDFSHIPTEFLPLKIKDCASWRTCLRDSNDSVATSSNTDLTDDQEKFLWYFKPNLDPDEYRAGADDLDGVITQLRLRDDGRHCLAPRGSDCAVKLRKVAGTSSQYTIETLDGYFTGYSLADGSLVHSYLTAGVGDPLEFEVRRYNYDNSLTFSVVPGDHLVVSKCINSNPACGRSLVPGIMDARFGGVHPSSHWTMELPTGDQKIKWENFTKEVEIVPLGNYVSSLTFADREYWIGDYLHWVDGIPEAINIKQTEWYKHKSRIIYQVVGLIYSDTINPLNGVRTGFVAIQYEDRGDSLRSAVTTIYAVGDKSAMKWYSYSTSPPLAVITNAEAFPDERYSTFSHPSSSSLVEIKYDPGLAAPTPPPPTRPALPDLHKSLLEIQALKGPQRARDENPKTKPNTVKPNETWPGQGWVHFVDVNGSLGGGKESSVFLKKSGMAEQSPFYIANSVGMYLTEFSKKSEWTNMMSTAYFFADANVTTKCFYDKSYYIYANYTNYIEQVSTGTLESITIRSLMNDMDAPTPSLAYKNAFCLRTPYPPPSTGFVPGGGAGSGAGAGGSVPSSPYIDSGPAGLGEDPNHTYVLVNASGNLVSINDSTEFRFQKWSGIRGRYYRDVGKDINIRLSDGTVTYPSINVTQYPYLGREYAVENVGGHGSQGGSLGSLILKIKR